jgi:hypothetical protein
MKRSAALLALLLAMTVAHGAPETQTLTGEFHWSGGGASGDLEAVFTNTGEQAWDVSFHFEFRGRPHVYTGTAEGSLSQGELRGKVKNEKKRRTFLFSGTVKDGKFRGAHAETEGGREQSTGTLTLSA